MPGSWRSPPRSSKVVVKALKPPASRNARRPASIRAASRSDSRCSPPAFSVGSELVRVLVLRNEPVDARVVDAADRRLELADAVPVDGDAEANLRLDLVAVRARDLAHVVAEAGDPQRLCLVPAAGRPRPGADPLEDARVRPVPGDGLPAEPHPRREVAELAIAVRRLVQVHEVHVDLRPRELAVELRVQVEERLLERAETGDPHLRGRERVHPGDQADALLGGVRLEEQSVDRLGARHRRRVHDAHRDRGSCGQPGRHLPRLLGDLPQHLLAVEVLASGDEPDLESVERFHPSPLAIGRGGRRANPAPDIRRRRSPSARRPTSLKLVGQTRSFRCGAG